MSRLRRAPYLRQVKHVSVVGDIQGIDGAFEGVDLLVWISNQDLPTALRQQHVQDGCNGGGAVKSPTPASGGVWETLYVPGVQS